MIEPATSLKHRISAVVRELGWTDAILYGVARALRTLVRRECMWKYYLVAQPVPQSPRIPATRGRQIEVGPLMPHTLTQSSLERPTEVIAARLSQGAACLGASKDGRLIGFQWFVIGPYDEDEVRCRFIPEPAGIVAWDFDVYIQPAHRSGLAFMRLWDETNAYLRVRGVRWTMSRISAFNSASLRSHRRLQARTLGSALFVRFGPLQIMFATLAPYLHVSPYKHCAPHLRLIAPES